MKTIGVVTVARSDYGIYLPVLKAIQSTDSLDLQLYVAGMHLSPDFGSTVQAIEADGFPIQERIEMLVASDSPEAIAKSMGLGLLGFAQAFSRCRPDVLLVLGDRFDMYTAALAALPFNIPVAHIHGGEVTLGAIDDSLRHSLTKLSHLHFVSTEEYGRRVVQLGEDPARVIISGAPALDNLSDIQLLDREQLEARFGLELKEAPLLVTFHSVTLEFERTEQYIDQLLEALTRWNLPIVFTQPNADTGGRIISEKIAAFSSSRENAYTVDNLGLQGYFSLMGIAAAMVGNSSSGIIESPSFKLPVVNIGSRQLGRTRAANVIDVECIGEDIDRAIGRALSTTFGESLAGLENPYGDGNAAQKIVAALEDISLDETLIQKPFRDIEKNRLGLE